MERRLSVGTTIVCVAAMLCLVGHVSVVNAQADDSMFGTHAVVFQPVRAAGNLISCTLVYRAVQADYPYRNGNAVVAVGNIGVSRFGNRMILGLKIGVKELGNSGAKFERPHFAYLQTKGHSTAKSRYEARDGDDGFRLIALPLDDPTLKLLFEMLDSGKVTIGFNRKKGGVDVLIPLDLRVLDAEAIPPRTFRRKRSDEALTNFVECFAELTK